MNIGSNEARDVRSKMCFNAVKSWWLGWYSEPGKEGHEYLYSMDKPGEFWRGKLVGIDDYLNDKFDEKEHKVILRIGPVLFMMFNRKKGVNDGVQSYGDKVVIVKQNNIS